MTECQADAEKMENYAMKALQAGNEADARTFLERKAAVESRLTELQTAYQLKLSDISDKLVMHFAHLRRVG